MQKIPANLSGKRTGRNQTIHRRRTYKGRLSNCDMFVKLVNCQHLFMECGSVDPSLCGTGIYYTFQFKFVQIREFKQGLKQVFGGIGKKHEKKKEK